MNAARGSRGALLGFAILLSGFASLTYQIVWVRRFAVVLGTTNAAVTLVLAMFLGGLGLGAILAARSGGGLGAARLARRFLVLELGAAGFAAGLPLYLAGTVPLVRAAATPESTLAPTAVLAALFLLPAATLMGATLPTLTALSRRVRDRGEAGAAGWLYAANTGGALIGSVAAARILIPELGLTGSSVCGIGANLAAGIAVWIAFGRTPVPGPGQATRSPWFGSRGTLPFSGIAALSGFAAMAAEIGWARLASLLFGPTIYTFACVVASVILGVALGSAAAGRLAERWRGGGSARTWLAIVQLGGAAASAAVAWFGSRLVLPIGELVADNAADVPHLLNLQFLGTAAVLLLPGLAFGATFPLAVGGAATSGGSSAGDAGRATGTIYATNASGNVLGALAAGFLIIPWLGIEAALLAAVLAQLAAALVAKPRVLTLLFAGSLAAFGAGATASWDWEALSGGLYRVAPQMEVSRHRDFLRRGELRFLEQGAAATVSVKEVGGELSLAIDGKVDATDGADMLTQRMLAHLPLLLHPAPDLVFIVGHGSGVTAGAALRHGVKRMTAAEISPEVAQASRLFAKSNRAPWADERFSLLEVDARNHLLFSRDSFDVVISEPSNPWMSGVSPLFTVEFFELVRSRLKDGGLFCQWIHLYNLAEESLRTVVGGFTDVFPEAALFVLHDGDALLIGAKGAFPPVPGRNIEPRIARLADELAPYGITDFRALRGWLTAAGPELAAWAAGAPRHRDDHPILEFRAPLSVHAATAFQNRRALERLASEPPFGPFGPAPSPDAGRLAGRAAGLLSAQNPDWALELARQALELDPAERSATAALVRAALASGRGEEGAEALRAALEDRSGGERDRAGAHRFARPAPAAGAPARPDEAAAVLEGGPAELAEDREALLLSAEVQVERGAGDSGLRRSAGAGGARKRPAGCGGGGLARRAEHAPRQGGGSRRTVRRHPGGRPETERALRVRAVALAELGRAEEAREAFSALVARSPGPAFHWANFGAFELASGRPAEAVRLYREAVDRDPTDLNLYRGLLEAAVRAGDEEQVRRAREVLGGR